MRISDPNSPGNPIPAANTETNVKQPAGTTRSEAASGTIAAGSDRAELSGVADRLSEILQSDSGARTERLRQLKEAVASGTYQVDSAAVSRAMIDEALSTTSGDASKNKS